MKGGKDEEKIIGPLFPRLHINDAEKGGPKAPPRNKMALYEQLSIPTQRFTSGSSNLLPLPHKDTRNLVPIHLKKSSYSILGNAPAPHLAERLHSHTSVEDIANTSSNNRSGKIKLISERDSGKLSIAANYNYFQFSNSKNTSNKRLRDEDECRVPAFSRLENNRNSVDEQPKKDDFSARMRHFKSTSDLFSKHHANTEGNLRKLSSCEGLAQNPASASADEVELLKNKKCLTDDSNRLHEKCEASMEKSKKRDLENINENNNACTLVGESLRRDDQSRSEECGELQLIEFEKNEENTEACNVDYVSGATISPDAVVEAIGQKQFWKTRRAIVHQQKVFAVQVFELHRLIQVQKLIAESPEILMENNFFLRKPSLNSSPEKKLLLENTPELAPITPKPKDTPQINNLIIDTHTHKGLYNLLSNYKPYTPTDPKPSPWGFPVSPSGNQWLVPVMSPSEGLIYKPYTGPLPPSTGLPGPIQSGPMGLTTPINEDYLKFGFFPPYFPPPLNLNPSISSLVVGPIGPINKARPKLNDQAPYLSSFSSYSMKNLMESKESEIHGSTASSPDFPDFNFRENALPLFPTAPTLDKPDEAQNSINHTRVIKVVPHNARSASESAARIFQSIQEERRQHG